MPRSKPDKLKMFNMEMNFELMHNLYDGVILYDTCRESHIVLEPEQRPHDLVKKIVEAKDTFEFIVSLSDDFLGLIDNPEQSVGNVAKVMSNSSQFEKKLYTLLTVAPYPYVATKVLDNEGNKKVRFKVMITQEVSPLIYLPMFISKDIEYIIIGKNCYISPKKMGDEATEKITF